MLSSLYIKNYALIDELEVSFSNGLTIITGETGAGKSILLGGLGLVLGNRADLSQIKDKDSKCVIEAVFDVANYNLKPLFSQLDLDYDVQTIIRREITPSGKSRAFINDTPVTLDQLSKLSKRLIDIHSQHQTQQLTSENYQFQVIDALAKNDVLLKEYTQQLKTYKTLSKALETLKTSKAELIKEYDYNLFLYNELVAVNLDSINLKELEAQYDTLNNVEDIKERLSNTEHLLMLEDLGVLDQLQRIKQELSQITTFNSAYENLYQRIESVMIELHDFNNEISHLNEQLMTNPEELDAISHQMQTITNLLQKHAVSDIADLIAIREELEVSVNKTENLDDTILQTENELETTNIALDTVAQKLSLARQKAIPKLITQLEDLLSQLGMPNAKFKIELAESDSFLAHGKDQLSFLFMANKGSGFNELRKSASGGEMSRIMLAVKYILSEYILLPSIMFDEIDTGVSGEISNKMGEIMKAMSQRMQVFAITHLPQIAAKGDTHFKVYKTDKTDQTVTNLKKLNEDDRVVEIAQMLGGINVTESALIHAKQLLN